MKKFTKKAIMLLVAVVLVGSVFGQQKRYVFALGGYATVNGVKDPNWGANWTDFRLNDVDRILYIWAAGETIGGTPAVGVGALGQTGYQAFNVLAPAAWWGCGYFVGPDSGNPAAQLDMTDITGAWTFNFSIRTDCATDITVNLYGSTVDPTDPFITTPTNGKYILNATTLPVSKRDKTQWVNYSIPVSQLMNPTGSLTTNNLRFLGPVKKCNYLTFGGGNDKGSFIAWDNIYYGAPTTGVNEVKAGRLDISLTDNNNTLNIFKEVSQVNIYSMKGACVKTSNSNIIDISDLSAGLYIVKVGNLVSKFTK